MIVRNESTSLKLCGVATVAHFESSEAEASAPDTSSRMNLQSWLKLSVVRGDLGGTYVAPADGATAKAGHARPRTTGNPNAIKLLVPTNSRRVTFRDDIRPGCLSGLEMKDRRRATSVGAAYPRYPINRSAFVS